MGTSPHIKIIQFRCILILLVLSRISCTQGDNKNCNKYNVTANVAVDPGMCVEHESITDKISRQLCVRKCQEMEQVISAAIAGSFRVNLFINLGRPSDLVKRSGSFMMINWPVTWFVC